MQDVINGGVYAVDLHGTESYEFRGVHPALIVRMLKEEKMYYVIPLTTYSKERWEKCKRKGFGTRIASTNSIARVDKMNIVSEKQIQGRYYNSGKLVVPISDEIETVLQRVEEYIVLSDRKTMKEYEKHLLQRTEFDKDMNLLFTLKDFKNYAYSIVIKEDILFEYPCSKLSFIDNTDIKDIIGQRIICSQVIMKKVGNNMSIQVKIEKEKLLTLSNEYDKFKAQKGSSGI